MSEFDLLGAAAGGMARARVQLDVAARNVAAAQASTPEHPYPRLVARFAPPTLADPDAAGDPVDPDPDAAPGDDPAAATVVPSGEAVDAMTEMVAVLDAQRSYEREAAVFDVGKRLVERTIALEGT